MGRKAETMTATAAAQLVGIHRATFVRHADRLGILPASSNGTTSRLYFKRDVLEVKKAYEKQVKARTNGNTNANGGGRRNNAARLFSGCDF